MSPSDRPDALRVETTAADGVVVLRLAGTLDGLSYRAVRDAIIKCALDAPDGIVLEVSALHVPKPSAWSVFTSAHWMIYQWPDVPVSLVCQHERGRMTIARNGIDRYVPVFGTESAAIDAMAHRTTPNRRRVREHWPATAFSSSQGREFVGHWLRAWALDDYTAVARVITTALVDNVIRHTASDPDLRLESDGTTVTIAVTDGSPTPASVSEDAVNRHQLTDLGIVSALTRAWGNTPLAEGKVVWAVMGPENRL